MKSDFFLGNSMNYMSILVEFSQEVMIHDRRVSDSGWWMMNVDQKMLDIGQKYLVLVGIVSIRAEYTEIRLESYFRSMRRQFSEHWSYIRIIWPITRAENSVFLLPIWLRSVFSPPPLSLSGGWRPSLSHTRALFVGHCSIKSRPHISGKYNNNPAK